MDQRLKDLNPSPYAVASSLEEQTVLLNTRTGRYYVLDAVGQRMWELLIELGRVQPVVQALSSEYNVPEQQLERDLLDLIEQLEQNGLLCKTTQKSETPL